MSGGVNILAVLGKVSSSVVLCLHCLVYINTVSINDVQICKDITFFSFRVAVECNCCGFYILASVLECF